MLANGWLSSFDNLIKGDAGLYSRYMDDVITVCEKESIDSKLKEINLLHSMLQFTVEQEKDGCLPFLDMV